MQIVNNERFCSDSARSVVKALITGTSFVTGIHAIAHSSFKFYQENTCIALQNSSCSVNHAISTEEICVKTLNSTINAAYIAGTLSALLLARFSYFYFLNGYHLRNREAQAKTIANQAPPRPTTPPGGMSFSPSSKSPGELTLSPSAESLRIEVAPLLPQALAHVEQHQHRMLPQENQNTSTRSLLGKCATVISAGLIPFLLNTIPNLSYSKQSICQEACIFPWEFTAECQAWESFECQNNCLGNESLAKLFNTQVLVASSIALCCAFIVFKKIRNEAAAH